MNKNDFIKQYLELPNKPALRYAVFVTVLLVNIFDFMIFALTEIKLLSFSFYDCRVIVFGIVVILFDIGSIAIIIFADRLSMYFYLQTAFAFTVSSVFYFYEANRLLFIDFGIRAILYSMISIAIYVLVMLTIIFNIRNKIKRRKQSVINNRNTAIIAFIGAVIGVLLPKPASLSQNHLPLILVLLILSYLLLFPSSGFHKYYLFKKINK